MYLDVYETYAICKKPFYCDHHQMGYNGIKCLPSLSTKGIFFENDKEDGETWKQIFNV